MRTDLWSFLAANRERLACAAAALLLALATYRTVARWPSAEEPGPAKTLLGKPQPLPPASFLRRPFDHYWTAGRRDPFLPPGRQALARGPAELPYPPLPPLPLALPPADPWPSLYRGPMRDRPHLLTMVAPLEKPALASGRECTIQPRPYDEVLVKGDPQPLQGEIRSEVQGQLMFYYDNPKGKGKVGHPRNPLSPDEVVYVKRRQSTFEEAYQERAEEAGDDAAAHLELAQRCFDCDRPAEALAELRRAIELAPERPAAYLKLADFHLAQGSRDDEVAVYRQAIAAGADSPRVRLRLGERCLELGLFRLAREHFDRGFALAAGFAVSEVLAGRQAVPGAAPSRRLLRKAAELRLIDGQRAEATRLLERLRAEAGDDLAAANALALAYLLAGRVAEAGELLEAIVGHEGNTRPVSAHNSLGAVRFHHGRYAEALGHFQATLQAAPEHHKAGGNAALAQAAQGRLDEAAQALARLDDPPPASLGYQLALGTVREGQGQHAAAIAAYQAALEVDRASLDALCGLGRCRLALGELAPAAARFDQALLASPDHPRALRGLATCAYRAEEYGRAVRLFGQLAEAEEASALDLARHGIACLRFQETRAVAARRFEEALRRPGEPSAHALMGKAYLAYAAGRERAGEARAAAEREADDLFAAAQAQAAAPEARAYVERALRRIARSRREVTTPIAFEGDYATTLPAGWSQEGRGAPAVAIRDDALEFRGRPAEANLRQVVRTVPMKTPEGRAFARVEFQLRAPVRKCNSTVGVLLGSGTERLQFGLRTQHGAEFTRRLAYRVVRGGKPSPWTDLGEPVSAKEFALGLGFGEQDRRLVELLHEGRRVGAAPFGARGDELEIGVFAQVGKDQSCHFTVLGGEIVRKEPESEGR
ncbi:MAG: tetratricopeptide repeat protein [Candidatus Brocadiia bacterium]